MSTNQLDLDDIQGNILRGYRKNFARHFVLTFGTATGARELIGLLTAGDGSKAPQVTSARPWDQVPPYCLNIGLTADGLKALGLPQPILDLFPAAYLGGPTRNASAIGDDGPSAPDNWVMGGPNNDPAHAIVSLYTNESETLGSLSAWLRSLFPQYQTGVALEHNGTAMPKGRVHFGYEDGISQPRIEGAPGKQRPDMQPESRTGEFLLGKNYVNQFNGNFIDDLPRELADNGTYGAFRILKQEVFSFEHFIHDAGAKYGIDPEMVAAKMVGRWRNGTPLTLSPNAPKTMPREAISNYDYAPNEDNPAFFDDDQGFRCPIGAHMRRMNPRSAVVMGKPHTRRIIRRNFPYGPAIKPGDAPDDIERGLVGFFICGDLSMQFEFLQKIWANQDISTTGIRGTRDPIIGAQPEHGGQFVIRTQDRSDPIIFDEVPRLVVTRGSSYCFIPSMTGLKFLASLAS